MRAAAGEAVKLWQETVVGENAPHGHATFMEHPTDKRRVLVIVGGTCYDLDPFDLLTEMRRLEAEES
jgi:hypothetical protein